jgi:hypothetical protein
MAEGGWVVLGTLIGGFATAASTWLNDYLRTRREDRLDAARKTLLQSMLNDQRFQWRSLPSLTHVIGADEATTKGCFWSSGRGGPKMARKSGA